MFASYCHYQLAMSLTFSLVACGGTKNASESNGNSSAVSDSTLKVQFDVEVASMDPSNSTDGTSFEVIAAITEGVILLMQKVIQFMPWQNQLKKVKMD